MKYIYQNFTIKPILSKLNNALVWEVVNNLNITNHNWTGGVTLLRHKYTISNGVSKYMYHIYGTLKHHSESCEWGEVIGAFNNVSMLYSTPITVYSNRGVTYNGLTISQNGVIHAYSPICDALVNIDEELYFSVYF